MRGRAAPPHPTIYRVPPPPPRANTNNTCIGSVNVNFDIWAVKKLAGTLVISLNYENKVTVKEFPLVKVQNNAKIISLLCGDFIGSEMVGWQGDQIPDGRVPQLTYRSEFAIVLVCTEEYLRDIPPEGYGYLLPWPKHLMLEKLPDRSWIKGREKITNYYEGNSIKVTSVTSNRGACLRRISC